MNDLLGMLNALNIYNSQDQVLLLDANTVQKIYSDVDNHGYVVVRAKDPKQT
jgi:hypothetical protein